MVGCIFCGTKDNISTSIKVKTAKGESVEPICAAHEDEASPKKVRELVEIRDAKIAEFAAILEPMGYKIVPIDAPAAPTPAPAPQAPLVAQTIVPHAPKTSDLVRPKKINTAKEIKVATNEFASANEGYNTAGDEAPSILEHEEQVVAGVGGMPVSIPKTVRDNAGGRTEITVNAGINNDELQKRFKNIADGETKFKTQGYGLKDCNFCSGTGKAKIGNNPCPRCKGVGSV